MNTKPPTQAPRPAQKKTTTGSLADPFGPRTPAPMNTQTTTLTKEQEEQDRRLEEEREEIRKADEEQTRQAKALRQIEAMRNRDQQRQEQPYASGSTAAPVDVSRPAVESIKFDSDDGPPEANTRPVTGKKKSVRVTRQDEPDYSYDRTTSEDEGSSDVPSIDSQTMKNKSRAEQTAVLGKVGSKFSSIMLKELESQDDVPQDVIREGIVMGAERTLDKYGRGPSVPPLYGRTLNNPNPLNPNAWTPYRLGGPAGTPGTPGGGGPGGGGPGGGGPGGPGGGAPGGPGGPANAPFVPANYAWFQRGTWNVGARRFRRSFHAGATPPGQELKLPKPPEYTGTEPPDEAGMWIQQVERHFILQPHLFMNDQRGIAWATSFLRGGAYMWYMPFWNTVGGTNHPITQRWAAFVHSFTQHFGDPDAEGKAETKLQQLKQVTSVRDYMDKFNTFQTKVQWDEIALISQFKEGLKPEVIRFGGTMGWPRELEELKQAAVRIDESLMSARIHERRQTGYIAPNPRKTPWTPRPAQPQSSQATQGNTAEANTATFVPNRPRGKITTEERTKRRREGLCMYCGQKGHLVAACPVANSRKMDGKTAETEAEDRRDSVDPFSGKGQNQ